MIADHQQFETALEAAIELLAARPGPGTPEHERLVGLLEDLHRYRPPADAPAEETEVHAEALKALGRQLAEFSAGLQDGAPEGSLSRFGFGGDLRGD